VSLETVTFHEELEKLDTCKKELSESNQSLRKFILSTAFLTDKNQFHGLLSDLQDKLVTLAEAVEKPMAGLPQQLPLPFSTADGENNQEEDNPFEEKDKSFSWPKASVIIFVLVASAVTVQQHLLPVEAFIAVIITSFFLLFFSSIKSMVQMVFAEKEKEREATSEAVRLEDWINESFSRIRSLYTSATLLVKIQNASKESLPDYGLPDMPEVLYNRNEYFNTILPSEFLSRIGRVIVACDKNLWARRSLLIHAITAASSQAAQGAKA